MPADTHPLEPLAIALWNIRKGPDDLPWASIPEHGREEVRAEAERLARWCREQGPTEIERDRDFWMARAETVTRRNVELARGLSAARAVRHSQATTFETTGNEIRTEVLMDGAVWEEFCGAVDGVGT